MKKIIKKIGSALLSLIIVVSVVPIPGVFALNSETLWSTSFESENDRSLWNFYDIDGDGNNFFFSSEYEAKNGNWAIVSDSQELNPDNVAVGPEISIETEFPTVKLSWCVSTHNSTKCNQTYTLYAYTGSSSLTANVLKNIDSSEDFTAIKTENLSGVGTGDYVSREAIIDTGIINSQKIRLVIRNHDTEDQSFLKFDSISLDAFIDSEEIWSCNFDNATARDQWTFNDADGDKYNWEFDRNYNRSAEYAISSYSFKGGKALTPNNFAISPEIEIAPNLKNIELDFYAGAYSKTKFSESFTVYIYKSGETLDFNNLKQASCSETLKTNEFTLYRVDLDAYCGETIKIVFRHTGNNNSRLTIDDMSITGVIISEPVAEVELNLETPKSGSIPSSAEVISGEAIALTSWSESGNTLSNQDVFEDGKNYCAKIDIQPIKNYAFTEDTVFILNGSVCDAISNGNGGYTLNAEYYINKKINEVSINVQDPVAGKELPSPSVVEDGVELSYQWLENNDDVSNDYVCKDGESYELKICVNAKDRYVIEDNAVFKINGTVAQAEYNGDCYYVNKNYYIDKKLSNIDISVECPKDGSIFPEASACGDSDGIVITTEWFSENSDVKLDPGYVCEGGKKYTLVASIEMKQGFVLSDDAIFTLNGNTVSPVFENGEYIVESEFIIDKQIKIVSININEPVTGKIPSEPLIIKGEEGITLSYNWIELESGKTAKLFENDNQYEFSVSLKAKNGYAFSDETVFLLNEAIIADYNISGDGIYTFSQRYVLTQAISNISVSIGDVVNGKALPQPDVVSEPDMVDYSYEWYENGIKINNNTVCSEDTDYELRIILKADNNNIDNRTEIKLNGTLIAATKEGTNYTISKKYHTVKNISSVDINIANPVINGSQPTPTSNENGVEVSGKWFDCTTQKTMQKTALFERGKSYYPVITIIEKSGYEFLDSVSFTLNGESISAQKSADGSYIIKGSECEFNKAVNYVNVKVDTPKIGCTQSLPEIISDCKEIQYEYEWLKDNQKLDLDEAFAEGTTYMISVVLKIPEGYDAGDATEFTINGKKINAVSRDENSYAVSMEFTTDIFIDFVGIELSAPEIGKNPSNPLLCDGTKNVSVSCKWYCKENASEITENSVFEVDKTYYAQITFTPDEKYGFSNLTEFSINGSKVSVNLSIDDKSFISEYNFSTLKNVLIEIVSVNIEAPGNNAEIKNIDDNSEFYSVEKSEWKQIERISGEEKELSDSFENSIYKYTYSFELKAKEGFEFSEDIVFSKIGGVAPSVEVTDSGKTCKVKYDFSDISEEMTFYTIKWIVNGNVIESSTYCENDNLVAPENIPIEPGKYFCYWITDDGNKVEFPINVKNNAEYIALFGDEEYTITFDVGDEIEFEAPESIKVKYGDTIEIPDYPKDGYTFCWTDGVISCVGDYTVDDLGENGAVIKLTAVYNQDTYIARFKADGKTVELVKYYSSTESITNPDIPEKAGYIGKWEEYTLIPGGITVNAEYEIITYEAKFYEDYSRNILTEVVSYNIEDVILNEPAVPEHIGYIGEWKNYSIIPEDIIIEAVYTPIEYEATFLDGDGNIVDVVKFTLNDEKIEEPFVPECVGYYGQWENYSIVAEDLTIKAVYAPVEYKAEFFDIDGNLVDTVMFTSEYPVLREPNVPVREGFNGKWSDYTVENGDLKIVAEYTPIKYYAKFFADGKSVGDAVEFTVESTKIVAPEIPPKEGYTGNWEQFSIQPQNLKINAEYTPIEYEAKFFADDIQVGNTIKFTVETDSIDEPDIPAKEGYTAKWEEYLLFANDIRIDAIYTPIIYTARFYDGNKQVGEDIKFTVEYEGIDEFDVPEHIGYTGKWTDYTIGAGDLQIMAEYTPIEYKASFYDGEEQIGESIPFTVETKNLEEPDVPEHIGYTGKWANYTIGANDLKINAEYTPIEYKASFYDGEEQVGESIPFTVETKNLEEPDVPEHIGYTGKWADYSIGANDLKINAEYTPIIYTAKFNSDGKNIKNINYTIQSMSIDPSDVPSVPSKNGYIGSWQDYELKLGGVTINAIYTCISLLKIKNNPTTKTIKFREGLILNAEVNDMPDDAKIVWYVNGEKYCEGTKFEKLGNKSDFKVTVKLIDNAGNCLLDSNGKEIKSEENIKVNDGFFIKIFAFFKSIFGGLPTIVQ